MKLLAQLIVSLLFSSIVVAQPAAPAKSPAPKLVNSVVYDFKDMKVEARPTGERRAAFDNPTVTLGNFECHVTTLKVGEMSGVAHAHDTPSLVEETILIKDGTVEVEINGAKQIAGSGSVIYFAPKDRTALRNVGKAPAVYFVLAVQAAPTASK